jgi:23S rRNA pseudouridine1911/1915/1917 synthase
VGYIPLDTVSSAPVTVTITEDHHGQRLDQALAALVPQQSRSQIQRLIKDGRVTVDGAAAPRASQVVTAGQQIALDVPEPGPAAAAPQDLPLDVVFEDADLVVVNKAPGVVVHPAAGHVDGTLVNALLHHVSDLSGVGGELRPGIVHRLDKGTSGLIVVAKHDRAHEELSRQFQEREVDKEYTALIWGLLPPGRRIEEPIGRDPNNRQKMSTRARRARTAVSRITWAEHFPGLALVGVAIATGRTHQIRVHLSAIGHPIVGDALYGGVRRRVPPELRAVQKLDRPFLHSARLAFQHPTDGRRLEFKSELPEDLAKVIEQLKHDVETVRY